MFLTVLCIIVIVLATATNIVIAINNYNQKQAFDDLIMRFISNNQQFYESQKGIIKSQGKIIDNAQKLVKDIDSSKTELKRLFLDVFDKFTEIVGEKKTKLPPKVDATKKESSQTPLLASIQKELKTLRAAQRKKEKK